MDALAAEGLAPRGMTKGDRGLCNGICSALRNTLRQERELAKELNAPAPSGAHPCMPAPRAADDAAK